MKKSITAHNSEETINIKQYKIWYIICTSELHTNLFISSNKEDLVETQLGEDDDDDNNKTFLWNSLSTIRPQALFPAGNIVGDSHHRKSPACCKKDLNLRRA